MAGGRRGAGADRHPHGRGLGRPRSATSASRSIAPRGSAAQRTAARCSSRSSTRALVEDDLPERRLPSRSRLAPAEGHRSAGADLPARRRGTAGRVPAASRRGAGQAQPRPSAPFAAGRDCCRRDRGRGRDPRVRDRRRLGRLRWRSRVSMRTRSARSTPRPARSSARSRSGRRRARSRSVKARSG